MWKQKINKNKLIEELIYIYIHIHNHTDTYIYKYISPHTQIYIYTRPDAHIYIHIYIHIYYTFFCRASSCNQSRHTPRIYWEEDLLLLLQLINTWMSESSWDLSFVEIAIGDNHGSNIILPCPMWGAFSKDARTLSNLCNQSHLHHYRRSCDRNRKSAWCECG